MRKDYFFVNPSNFARIGEISIDGDYDYVQFKDFNVDEPRVNYLFFEVKYTLSEDKKIYSPVAREVITGKKFDLEVQDRRNRSTGNIETTVILVSEELGLYSKTMNINDVESKPSRLSGIFYHFRNNPDEKKDYCWQLKYMFEEARTYKHLYDNSVDGPNRYLTGEMKRTYKKTKLDE